MLRDAGGPHVVTLASRPRLRELVSPKVGLVRTLRRLSKGVEEPTPPILYQAILAHFDFRRVSDADRSGGGKGETEDEAVNSAVGEALERYCGAHPNPAAMITAPLGELTLAALDPSELVLYSPGQYARQDFPYRPLDPQRPIAWVRAQALPDGAEVLVPAQLVYMSLGPEHAEDPLCMNTSNGIAAGPDLPSAILHGLCELIERDAFLIAWMNKLPLRRVEPAGLRGLARQIYRHYQLFGIDVRILDATTDIGVPVILAIALDNSGRGPAAVVGLACHPDPRVALRKALLEVCQVRPGETTRFRQRSSEMGLPTYESVRSLLDHSAFFWHTEHLSELAHFLDSPHSVGMDELPCTDRGSTDANLAECVERLRAIGSRPLYVDITTPDVASIGAHVVRTLATELQPMHFGSGYERLGGRRLYEVPLILGHAASVRSEADLNRCPHPMA